MKQSLLAIALVVAVLQAQAIVKMPALFADNGMLQRQTNVAIWGWADAKAKVTLVPSWNGKSYEAKADRDGKWRLTVETPEAGGPYEIRISDGTELVLKNILIGEVWLCSGQSNMEMPMKGFSGQPVVGSNIDILKSDNHNIRLITVPHSSQTVPYDDFTAKWKVADPAAVRNFSATGYYFGRMLNELLDVPVGLIEVAYGGSCVQAWMSPKTAVAFEDKQVPAPGDSIPVPNRTPTVLFNGMLSPVIGYGIKGCIWYQGETNHIEPDRYLELFPTMVAEWRSLWGIGDFPFFYAQIAPYNYAGFSPKEFHEKHNSAYLREAQLKALDKIPNAGMAVLMDLGEKECIHPMHKREGGERLALWALAQCYGFRDFSFKSPSYSAMEVKGSQVIVSFNEAANGLTTFGKDLSGFEIAGEDKVFYPADALLRSKSVVVSSPRVEKPVAVRYAFKDFVMGTLYGTDGLPVSSFRTDEW